ncbi:MAG: glycosyltransferase family 4 protein [Candidatus Schekmanbacteria bacterium]|nr:glycosyltransferase family 4 protein [Candidatus Schekmanbacteria bacterium]
MAKQKIAYINTSLGSEFILREMLELANQGIDLHIFALGKKLADLEKNYPLLNQLKRPVYYSPYLLSLKILWAHIYYLAKKPKQYLAVLKELFTNSNELAFILRALAIFPKSVYYAKLIEEQNIRYIHAHWATTSTASAMIIARLLGLGFSFTGHAWDIFVDTYGLRQKIKKAKCMVTCTQFNQKYLITLCENGFADKIKVNYHGLNPNHYQPLGSRSNGKFNILAVGRMVEKKGFKYLIEALHLLKKEGMEFSAEIIGGNGPAKEEIIALHRKYQLGDRVKISNHLPHPQVIEKMKSADVFVLPCVTLNGNRQDGLPNVFIEALALEVPVISTDISAIPELVHNMETGLIVPPADVLALKEAIKKLYHDPDLRQRLGKAGRQRVCESFDIRKNVAQLAELITA